MPSLIKPTIVAAFAALFTLADERHALKISLRRRMLVGGTAEGHDRHRSAASKPIKSKSKPAEKEDDDEEDPTEHLLPTERADSKVSTSHKKDDLTKKRKHKDLTDDKRRQHKANATALKLNPGLLRGADAKIVKLSLKAHGEGDDDKGQHVMELDEHDMALLKANHDIKQSMRSGPNRMLLMLFGLFIIIILLLGCQSMMGGMFSLFSR